MSAVIQNEYTQNDTTTVLRQFTFPYLKTSDIKVSLDGVETTAFTLANATTIQFNSVPPNGAKIKIFRETSVDSLTATFYAGSAIKSEDLNDNFTQNLYKTQEVGERALNTLGGTMTGNLTLDTQADLVFEGSSADDHETTIKVVNPTADRTITFPNVTGNVVTTGDTGTVATGMIASNAVTTVKIADDAITTAKIANQAITSDLIQNGGVVAGDLATNSVTTDKIVNDAVTLAKMADNSIDSDQYVDGSIEEVHLNNNIVSSDKIINGAVIETKIGASAVTTAKLADNSVTLAKMADDSVGTAELVDGSVDTARLADNSVTLAKMADSSVGTSEIVDAAVTTAKLASNAVTTAKITDANVTTAKLANDAVTNDKLADNSVSTENIQDGDISTAKIASSAVTAVKIASDAVTTVKIPDDAVTTAKIQDSELKTLAGMPSATASKLADSTALTADIADLNQIDGLTKQTTISDSDASFPTSGAVVDYVAAQIAPLGGLEVVATEVAFPNTQPSSGVVISISDAGGVVINGSGVSTTGRTVGGSTVTINGFPSSLHSETLAAGVGLMVSSTGSSQTYNYHKILGKESDIKQLSDDINDFAERYRVGSSNPTSALDAGDLFFNTSTSKLLVYNATNSAWEEAQSIGNFFISTLSPAFDNSTQNFTITNAPTNAEQIILSINGVIQKPNAGTSTPSEGFALDGSTIKLSAAPASGSDYFAVVIGSTVNIGQPSNNTVSTSVLQNSSVTTGKIADSAVTASKIGDANVTTGKIADNAITASKITNANVTTAKIADGAVTTSKIADGAILNADVNASAAIAGSKINPSFTSNITVTNTTPKIFLTDSNNTSDFSIQNENGNFNIYDETNNVSRVRLLSTGLTGINTTGPESDLHVCTAGSSEEDGTFRVGGSSAGLGLLLNYDQSVATVSKIHSNPTYNNAAALFHIACDGDTNPNQLVLKGDGNVGINDSAPSYPLNIIGDNAASNGTGMLKGILGVQNDTTAFGSSPTAGISFQTKYRTGPDVPLDVAAIWGGKENTTNGDKDGYMGFATREEGGSGNQERMRIHSGGRVSIGTDSADATLHIKSPDGANSRLCLEQSTDAANYQNGIDFKNAGTQMAHVSAGKDASNNSFGLRLGTGTGHNQYVQIDANGYMTNSNQPMFSYRGNTSWSTISNGNSETLTPSNSIISSTHYNTSNGRFTAPVAGYYFFIWNGYTKERYMNTTSAHYISAGMTLNGTSRVESNTIQHYQNASDGDTGWVISWTAYLSANDYVATKINANGADFQYYGAHNSFSGWLVK